MINQIVYTNSNCKDAWDMFIQQNKKHTKIDLCFISDLNNFKSIDDKKIFLYENADDYWSVWVMALKKFNVNNFIYLQEDFILYDNVNDDKIEYLTELLNNSEYSFIRLIKSGNLNNKKISDNLYEIESTNDNIFSMQPTIWKTKDYIKIMEGVKDPKWLENKNYNNFMVQNNIKGLYYYNNEPKRGGSHYDSEIYPYIATALVKGKWNLSEYKKELGTLLEQYNIDKDLRGVF
jgi:hypothetical protein